MKALKTISATLMAVGGINLGLIGAFDFDLLWRISGYSEVVVRTIYVLIGIGTLVWILTAFVKRSGSSTGTMS